MLTESMYLYWIQRPELVDYVNVALMQAESQKASRHIHSLRACSAAAMH